MSELNEKRVQALKLKEQITAFGVQIVDIQNKLTVINTGNYGGVDVGRNTLITRHKHLVRKSRELKQDLARLNLEIKIAEDQEPAAAPVQQAVQSDRVADLVKRVRDQDLRLTARVAAAENLIALVFPNA